jgi:tyrosyl-tRNA synthetase
MSQDFYEIIKERGFLHQCTDEIGLREYLKQGAQAKAYIGFDCTAPSLHVGSLLQIMLLRWWQKCGHTPIVLMGGGTTKIGDPSGKDETRKVISDEDIAFNMAGIQQVFAKFLRFGDASGQARMVNNDDWLSKLSLMDMLQIGRHFSVNRMVKQKSVQLRLERDQEMSLLEFNYSVMQAYDFVELNKLYGCRVQMGGSDQWGNIVAGINLHHALTIKEQGVTTFTGDDATEKALAHRRKTMLFGMTSPLITTASGAKMGKTAAGAVWLNEDLCSAYEYWQFWRNTEDADVEKFLKLFTELPMNEIAKLAALGGAEINEAKKILATEATAMLHGREKAAQAAQTARTTFEQGAASENLPEILLSSTELAPSMPVYALLVKAGFASSNGEARRLMKGGGAKLNDTAVAEDATLTHADFAAGSVKLSAGKKRHALVRLAS